MTDKKLSGIKLIAQERYRQIDAEGFGVEHDAGYVDSELAWAACYYAMPCLISTRCDCGALFLVTPEAMFSYTGWDKEWAKRQGFSGDRIRDLAKAGALIAAEIDRLQRETPDPEPEPCEPDQ